MTIAPLPLSLPRPETFFDDDFYHQVFSDPSAAIRYINLFSTQLDEEIKRAFSLCSAALELPYRPEAIGRAVREVARAITTNVEGTIGFTSFFMRAVRRSKAKISIPQRNRGESVPERLINVLTAFSEAFGGSHQIGHDDRLAMFASAFDIRDRLTHPRGAADLDLGLNDLDTFFQALGWFHEQAMPAIVLNEQKIGECFGSRRPLKRS
ncbi:MAG TPA: hypothetical protein VH988_08820 [Thermoanaerobaculia bacterium]|nr:hypothetical protein [Thermoanaerobaculia bacterium]